MLMEEEAQQLRSRATELLLLDDWEEYIRLYTRFISLCLHHVSGDAGGDPKLQKILCGALSNRAEARLRLRDLPGAAGDCDRALDLDPSHLKTLICKGKILLGLDRYSSAADCFRRALAPLGGSDPALRGLIDRCQKLEAQSKTGAFDLSQWVLDGFKGDPPELAEYVGPVVIRRSVGCGGGRGLFATRNIESGTMLVVTKAVVIGRGILPEPGNPMSSEGARLVMWKDFVTRLLDAAGKCRRTLRLIYLLSTGEDEEDLPVPDIRLFVPEQGPSRDDELSGDQALDTDRILKILDVNCLADEAVSAKVLGKNGGGGYHGVGLWLLASFINHSCNPNARRLHVGNHLLVHASRDIKGGEEITFPYFDVLMPLRKRRETMAGTWGFCCRCRRCQFEEAAAYAGELREMEESMVPEMAARLEEAMAKRWVVKSKEKAFLRASFWEAYTATYATEREVRKWRGGFRRRWRRRRASRRRWAAMRGGVYGKVAKKQAAMRILLGAIS
ncbi:unnamed protein product [Spirodela intermedia]|uniref:SET domain-containing protein n=1 Tax=Spirodela intermedia TaxID=51605 RepID=A0A7I8J345_SPIIN|nr:unnamed protein product [Spirodela intermedia]CAA6664538.1 unnamed protein product [Spirodela intermedia]